jgi:hypothetical protein
MLRSRGHPPRARSLECRSYSLSRKCVSAGWRWCWLAGPRAAAMPRAADDTGFVLLLLLSTALYVVDWLVVAHGLR